MSDRQFCYPRALLEGWYEEDPKDACGYDFLRFEHECLMTTGYLRRGIICNVAPARVALRSLFIRMRKLEEHLWGSEQKLYQRVEHAWGHAYTLRNRFVVVENLSHPVTARSLAPKIERVLACMRERLDPVIPPDRPSYQAKGDWLAVVTKMGRA